jgi:predicted amidohydrolase
MNEIFIISLVQMKIFPGKVEKNVENALSLLEEAKREGSHMALLPEMFSSGFYYNDLPGVARETPAVITLFKKFCKREKIAIYFSAPELDQGRVFNTAYIIGETGRVRGKYRKVHLFGLFREDRYFAGGEKLSTARVGTFQISPLICYDLRFPEVSRAGAVSGSHLITYCAQWPVARVQHWKSLLVARAIENQLFVAAVNGTGTSGKIHLAGNSMVVSPTGEVILNGRKKEGCYTARLNKNLISDFRSKMNCLKDRKPEAY